jgi:hypothetical protein
MVGRGGIWGGGLDTWSSMGVTVTVRLAVRRKLDPVWPQPGRVLGDPSTVSTRALATEGP